MNTKKLRRLGCFIVCFLMAGCAIAQRRSNPVSMLLGLWEVNTNSYSEIILRKSDGTFLEKGNAYININTLPIKYIRQGLWKIEGQAYIEKQTDVSFDEWKTSNGKEVKYSIIKIESKKFIYMAHDSDRYNIQNKISDISESRFNSLTPKALPASFKWQ